MTTPISQFQFNQINSKNLFLQHKIINSVDISYISYFLVFQQFQLSHLILKLLNMMWINLL